MWPPLHTIPRVLYNTFVTPENFNFIHSKAGMYSSRLFLVDVNIGKLTAVPHPHTFLLEAHSLGPSILWISGFFPRPVYHFAIFSRQWLYYNEGFTGTYNPSKDFD
jgi:hypothetical protein